MKIVYISIIVLVSCKSTNNKMNKIGSCDKDKIINVADSIVKKNGYKIKLLSRIVEENERFYLIHYTANDSLIRGNEARIKIDKSTCLVTEKTFYQ